MCHALVFFFNYPILVRLYEIPSTVIFHSLHHCWFSLVYWRIMWSHTIAYPVVLWAFVFRVRRNLLKLLVVSWCLAIILGIEIWSNLSTRFSRLLLQPLYLLKARALSTTSFFHARTSPTLPLFDWRNSSICFLSAHFMIFADGDILTSFRSLLVNGNFVWGQAPLSLRVLIPSYTWV